MEKTEKFFIFTWKELIVIVLLVLTLVGFFFTLGLHYGKKIHPVEHAESHEEGEKLEESPESLPPRETLEEGSQHTKTIAAETLKEATKEEVAEADVKLDQAKAVALPEEKTAPKHEEKEKHEKSDAKAEVKSAPTFSLQLGSYASKREAQQKVKVFYKRGVEAQVHTAEVNHQTRYRVIIPGFKNKASADQRGKDLKGKHKIENFVVIKQ